MILYSGVGGKILYVELKSKDLFHFSYFIFKVGIYNSNLILI